MSRPYDGAKEFWDAQEIWSENTFGPSSPDWAARTGKLRALRRGPIGPLKHLQKEVAEALEHPDDLLEYADLLFLIFDATRRAGFTFDELLDACFYKLAVNKRRQWQKPSGDEPVEHVRG